MNRRPKLSPATLALSNSLRAVLDDYQRLRTIVELRMDDFIDPNFDNGLDQIDKAVAALCRKALVLAVDENQSAFSELELAFASLIAAFEQIDLQQLRS